MTVNLDGSGGGSCGVALTWRPLTSLWNTLGPSNRPGHGIGRYVVTLQQTAWPLSGTVTPGEGRGRQFERRGPPMERQARMYVSAEKPVHAWGNLTHIFATLNTVAHR